MLRGATGEDNENNQSRGGGIAKHTAKGQLYQYSVELSVPSTVQNLLKDFYFMLFCAKGGY
ncbi:MAG: hypothetical protein ACSNEK_09155 [Parachlamydiaceae bacterium]